MAAFQTITAICFLVLDFFFNLKSTVKTLFKVFFKFNLGSAKYLSDQFVRKAGKWWFGIHFSFLFICKVSWDYISCTQRKLVWFDDLNHSESNLPVLSLKSDSKRDLMAEKWWFGIHFSFLFNCKVSWDYISGNQRKLIWFDDFNHSESNLPVLSLKSDSKRDLMAEKFCWLSIT